MEKSVASTQVGDLPLETFEEYMKKIEGGKKKANFAIFGNDAFQQTLGELTIEVAKEKAKRISKKVKLLRLIVITPEWGGVQISF